MKKRSMSRDSIHALTDLIQDDDFLLRDCIGPVPFHTEANRSTVVDSLMIFQASIIPEQAIPYRSFYWCLLRGIPKSLKLYFMSFESFL